MIKNKIISYSKTLITASILLLTNVMAIYLVDFISDDFNVGFWYNAIILVVAVAVVNSLLWPIFQRFLMKFIIFTLGIATIFINS